jgi:hypothetical protein
VVLAHGDVENELFEWFCSASVKSIVVDCHTAKEMVEKIALKMALNLSA